MKKFSPKVKEVINYSKQEAIGLGHNYIGTEHLLLGIMREPSSLTLRVLDSLDVDSEQLRQFIKDKTGASKKRSSVNSGSIPINKKAEKVLKVTFLEAKMMKSDEVSTEHLVLSILKHKDNVAAKALNKFDVDYEIFKSELDYVREEIVDQACLLYTSPSPRDS